MPTGRTELGKGPTGKVHVPPPPHGASSILPHTLPCWLGRMIKVRFPTDKSRKEERFIT